jgi:hypothetical protein
VVDLQKAEANVELAVLSAIEHARGLDVELGVKIASAAIVASASLDVERSSLYHDMMLRYLSEDAHRAIAQNMNRFGYEYQSDFARRYVAEGRAEGRLEGRKSIILRQLALRFGPLPEAIDTRLRAATESHLDALAERVLTVRTLEEALRPLQEAP